jgi:hypothetical protein
MKVAVRLHDATETKLRRLAKEKGVSPLAFVRAAIVGKLDREAASAIWLPIMRDISGRSCAPNTAVVAGPAFVLLSVSGFQTGRV